MLQLEKVVQQYVFQCFWEHFRLGGCQSGRRVAYASRALSRRLWEARGRVWLKGVLEAAIIGIYGLQQKKQETVNKRVWEGHQVPQVGGRLQGGLVGQHSNRRCWTGKKAREKMRLRQTLLEEQGGHQMVHIDGGRRQERAGWRGSGR